MPQLGKKKEDSTCCHEDRRFCVPQLKPSATKKKKNVFKINTLKKLSIPNLHPKVNIISVSKTITSLLFFLVSSPRYASVHTRI